MFGQRLRLARKKSGLSMRALADCVTPKITAQAISKYEAGKMMPSSAVLVGLGKALDVPLDFLMSDQVVSLDKINFRKHSGTSARDRAVAEALVTEKLENYLVVEDILDLGSQPDPLESLRCDRVGSLEEVEAKAEEVRQAWGLGADPISSMTGLLEDKGVKVIEANLPKRFDGLACDVKCGGRHADTQVVVISSHTNVERKRFNLAHELAHRVIRETGNPAISIEKAVDRFAGAFLVPAGHLREEVGEYRRGVTYHEIIRLKHTYGVSAAAMLVRLGQTGILAQTVVDYAFRSYARSWRTNEPKPMGEDEGFAAFETPGRFERLSWRALGEQLISPLRAAQLLDLSLDEVEREIRGPCVQ